jgi:hypothetical protein
MGDDFVAGGVDNRLKPRLKTILCQRFGEPFRVVDTPPLLERNRRWEALRIRSR